MTWPGQSEWLFQPGIHGPIGFTKASFGFGGFLYKIIGTEVFFFPLILQQNCQVENLDSLMATFLITFWKNLFSDKVPIERKRQVPSDRFCFSQTQRHMAMDVLLHDLAQAYFCFNQFNSSLIPTPFLFHLFFHSFPLSPILCILIFLRDTTFSGII